LQEEGILRLRGFMTGARAAVMVAGTATAVGVALMNDRRPRPVFVEAAPPSRLSPSTTTPTRELPEVRGRLNRTIALAAAITVVGILFAASVPAVTTVLSGGTPTQASVTAPVYGPPAELRASAGIAGNWERSLSATSPSATQLGGILMAAAEEQYRWDVLRAINTIAAEERAREQAQAQVAGARSVPAPAAPTTLNSVSGLVPGTVLTSRITIYGCTGPGGGFCGNMASGIRVFEGAAACSTNLPFGTKFTIAGDPTGRTYECLDRGALGATWVDVFFHDTSAGMAWQSSLGGTVRNITIVN
jgi:hypothetical protein